MIWTDNFFLILITTLTAAISLLIWRAIEKSLRGWGGDSLACMLLICSICLHLIPVGYLMIDALTWIYNGRSLFLDVAFLPTPFLTYVTHGLAILWVVGMIWHLRGYVYSAYMLRKLVRGCMPVEQKEHETLKHCLELTGVRKTVTLLKGYAVHTPMLVGVIRPLILLPADREYTKEELECILVHELMHIRNGDLVVKKLAVIAEDIHWFNPVTRHLLLKSVNEWTEYRCDNSTCANYVDRKIYYETLLSNAVIQTGQVGTYNTALLESSTQVTKRIKYMEVKKRKKKISKAAALLLTCTFIIINGTAALAAGFGSVALHRPVYDATVVRIREPLQPPKEYEEFIGNDDFSSVSEGEVKQNERGGGYFGWVLNPGTTLRSPVFAKNSGDTIRISVDIDPSSVSVDVGIVQPNGSQTYITGSGWINHEFSVTQTGSYKVFVRNIGSEAITANGYYR